MPNAKLQVPKPTNEPILGYRAGSPEKKLLKKTLLEMMSKEIEIPLIIGGKEIKTGNLDECRIPHDHKHIIGKYHKAGAKEVAMAIEVALEAREKWTSMPWEDRIAIFREQHNCLLQNIVT